jgi:hypothetical protein
LINASVHAGQEVEFSKFLNEYKTFREKRNLQNQGAHNARFQGALTFRNECGGFYSDEGCGCPAGNTYLQCLTSAQAVISVDPNDIGGRGYVLVTSGASALNAKGQWVPSNERNVYSFVIEPLASSMISKPRRHETGRLEGEERGAPHCRAPHFLRARRAPRRMHDPVWCMTTLWPHQARSCDGTHFVRCMRDF